jgi:hypothetical protein
MSPLVRLFVPALFALGATVSAVSAQSAPPSPQQADGASGDRGHHRRPTADTIQRMQDGKLALAKAALKMSDAQLKLWVPVEDLIRAQQAARSKTMQEWAAKRTDRAGTDKAKAEPSMAERFERHSARLAVEAERTKAFAQVFKPFHESLSDEQKAVAGPVLAEVTGGDRGRGHGHRWAHNRNRGNAQQ